MPVHNIGVSKLSQSTVVENVFVVLHACTLHLSIVGCHKDAFVIWSLKYCIEYNNDRQIIMFQQPSQDRQMYSLMTDKLTPPGKTNLRCLSL